MIAKTWHFVCMKMVTFEVYHKTREHMALISHAPPPTSYAAPAVNNSVTILSKHILNLIPILVNIQVYSQY